MNQPYENAQEQADETVDAQEQGPLTGNPVEKTESEPKVQAQPKPQPQQKRQSKRDRKAASAFRTISEVADILDVQQHVLRFWETKFSQIRPLKRGGGRRYYRPEDLELLKKIHHLLYTEGYTIKGVQKLLREKGKAALVQEGKPAPQATPVQNNNEPSASANVSATVKGSIGGGMSHKQRSVLKNMVSELKELRALIKPE